MERRLGGRGEERAGLVSLGLIMQLVGSITAAFLICRAIEPMLHQLLDVRARGVWYHFGDFYSSSYNERLVFSPPWHLMLLAGGAIARALLHRRAGGVILYGRRGGLAALWTYLAAAFLHTGLCLAVLFQDMSGASYQWSIVALLGAAWPFCLLVAVARPSFRRALRRGPAVTDGAARAEVATLAIFAGLIGAMIALFAVYAALEVSDRLWPRMMIAFALLLLGRSAVQLGAGLRTGRRPAGADELVPVARYAMVGLVSSVLAGAALIVVVTGVLESRGQSYFAWRHDYYTQFPWDSLVSCGLAAYLVLLWPLLLRRFVRARMAATVATGESCTSSRALPALGWLLLAAGTLQVSFAAVELLAGQRGVSLAWSWAHHDVPVGIRGRSAWLQLLVVVPQLWTAVEILGATGRRRAAATAYAACASVATVLAIWVDLRYLMRLIDVGLGYPTILLAYLQVSFPLLVPIVTLVFVQHQLRGESARG